MPQSPVTAALSDEDDGFMDLLDGENLKVLCVCMHAFACTHVCVFWGCVFGGYGHGVKEKNKNIMGKKNLTWNV